MGRSSGLQGRWQDVRRDRRRGSISFKANDVAFAMLVETGQARPSPYMARAQWLYVDDLKQFPPAELRQYIAASHGLVTKKLTKKLQRELGLTV